MLLKKDGGLWLSRIRVEKGVENVLVCDAMVEARGEGRESFIAGSSTHNQRIERLWRDAFRCVLHYFYYVFYAMEDAGIFYLDNPTTCFHCTMSSCQGLTKHFMSTKKLLTSMVFGQQTIGPPIKCG